MTEENAEGPGCVPIKELCDLVDAWRRDQERLTLPRSGLTNEGYEIKQRADELEAVIEDYTNE